MGEEQLIEAVKKFRDFAGQGILEYYIKSFSESVFPSLKSVINETFTSEESSNVSDLVEGIVSERTKDLSENMSFVFSEMLLALITGKLVQLQAFEVGLATLLKITFLNRKS